MLNLTHNLNNQNMCLDRSMNMQQATKETEPRKFDKLDITIIKKLLKNSRTSFAEIAEECNVSTATINNRFNELTTAGIITGSTVIIDLAHFGVECSGSLLLNVNPNLIDDFLRDFRGILNDFFIIPIALNDKFNVLMVSRVKNFRSFEKIKEMVKQHSAVIDVKMDIWTYMKVYPENLKLES